MDPTEFLDLAGEWAVGSREGEWRSSVSRAYYAVFHVARNLLRQAGFQVPMGTTCHQYLYFRLNNYGDVTVRTAADLLNRLRRARNEADYDLDTRVAEQNAIEAVDWGMDVNAALTALANNPALLAQVMQAIRDYERVTLGVVTWQGP